MAGFRSGIEPVLLAASIPAQAGERVLEGGTGAGAALLCLGSRIPGLRGIGVEADPALAALAAENLAANGLEGFAIRTASLDASEDEGFDHALANPPYHAAASTPSPDPRRETAKRADPGTIAGWVAALARRLRSGGTLTVALSAPRLPEALAALSGADCGGPAILPLWPRPGRDAKLLLLRAVRGSRAPCRLLPGLTLHGEGAGYTPEAEAILRDGAPLLF